MVINYINKLIIFLPLFHNDEVFPSTNLTYRIEIISSLKLWIYFCKHDTYLIPLNITPEHRIKNTTNTKFKPGINKISAPIHTKRNALIMNDKNNPFVQNTKLIALWENI